MDNKESILEGKTLVEIEAWFLEKQAVCSSARCRKPIEEGYFKMYQHEGGLEVTLFRYLAPNDYRVLDIHYGSVNKNYQQKTKMWVYYRCPHCGYQSAWHRLIMYFPREMKH